MKIFNGDCFDILRDIESRSIDMILSDLSFGTTKHKWDKVIDLTMLWPLLCNVIKPNGAIVLFCVQPFTTKLIFSHLKGYKHSWVWDKGQAGNFAVAKYMPLTITEDIAVFTANGEKANYFPKMRSGKLRVKGGKNSQKNGSGFGGLKNISYTSDSYYPTNILRFAGVPRTQRRHPAQKPAALLQYLMDTYSLPGDTVLDCMMGSGSTGKAALEINRNFVGIELDKIIYERANNWLHENT